MMSNLTEKEIRRKNAKISSKINTLQEGLISYREQTLVAISELKTHIYEVYEGYPNVYTLYLAIKLVKIEKKFNYHDELIALFTKVLLHEPNNAVTLNELNRYKGIKKTIQIKNNTKTVISKVCRENGINYSQFIAGLRKGMYGVPLCRKTLAEIAFDNQGFFLELIEFAKASLRGEPVKSGIKIKLIEFQNLIQYSNESMLHQMEETNEDLFAPKIVSDQLTMTFYALLNELLKALELGNREAITEILDQMLQDEELDSRMKHKIKQMREKIKSKKVSMLISIQSDAISIVESLNLTKK